MLQKCICIFSVGRYDAEKGNNYKTLGKSTSLTMGFAICYGYQDADRGHIIENIIFLELLRRDYRVYIGKVGETEVDFVAEKAK